MPVQRIVGGVEIEDDFLGRSLVGVQENPDEQARNGRRVMRDLVIAARLRPAQFETVQRRFAGHRRAVFAAGFQLAR